MGRTLDIARTPVTWALRIVTGALFIFSGFVKAIDPWGTFYKFQEYFAAWHLDVWSNLTLFAVFALCIWEFLTGIFLISGSFRRSAPVMGLLLMAVMLPLTAWIAIADPVDDCGCFGDAIVLSNWQTFFKNIVITAMLVWLAVFNRSARCLIRPSLQWIGLVVSALYVLVVGEAGYLYQPLLDFRPYPEGSMLADDSAESGDSADDSGNMVFVYARDGVEKRFSISDELPDEDSGWEFVRREETKRPGSGADTGADAGHESTFRVWSEDGDEDVTDEAVPAEGKVMLLLMPDPESVSVASTWKINSLKSWAGNQDIAFEAVMAGDEKAIADWRDISLADYPIYRAEDTEIKMLARGNPAIVFVENGRIVWKSSLRALPDKDFLAEGATVKAEDLKRDNVRILLNVSLVYLIFMITLGFLSYTPAFFRMLFFRRR